MKPSPPQLMRVSRAAKLLDCDPKEIRRMIADGRLRGYQLGANRHRGNATRVAAADVVAFVERRRLRTGREGDR